MVDAPLAHFHYVEADIRLAARLHDEPAGDIGIAAALVRFHRLGGGAVRLGKARLDLAEDDRLPVARDDVCLAEGGLVVGLQDAVAEALQVRGGEPLPLPAESFFVNVLR